MSRIISHYRLIELVGRGGTGQVWKAEDLSLNRTVAIKLLTEELTGDRDAKERIQSEARMAAALNHPNIAAVYELGEYEGNVYITMEWVEGENLKSQIARDRLELKSSLEFALVALAADDVVRIGDLPAEILRTAAPKVSLEQEPLYRILETPVRDLDELRCRKSKIRRALAEVERNLITRVIEESGGNLTEAASRMGLHRITLHRMLKRTDSEE